jgi:hypothetical protein
MRYQHSHTGGLDPAGKITPALVHDIGQNALDIVINAAETEGPEDPLFWIESAGNIAALVNDASTIAIGHPIIPAFVVNDLMLAGQTVGLSDAAGSIFDKASEVAQGTASLADLSQEVAKNIPGIIAALPNLPEETKAAINSSFSSVADKVTSLLSGLKL